MQLDPYTWRLIHLELAFGYIVTGKVINGMMYEHDKIQDNAIL